jgi:hypothetical protein
MIATASSDNIHNLPETILSLNRSIRHCAIIDKLGYIVASQTRKNLQLLMTEANGQRQALQSAIRHFKRSSFEQNLGPVYYTVTRYEKVIGATIPISKNYIMLVAFDHDTDTFDKIIMQSILPLIEECRAKRIFDAQA